MLYFVTSRKRKFTEAQKILNLPLKQVDLDLPEIQALEVEEVVKAKARAAYQEIKKPCLVEDSGLYLEALKGFPGALGKWIEKTIGWDGFLKLLHNVKNRRAYGKCMICFYDGKKYHLFSGRVNGRIARKLAGDAGFGWDTIFIPKGYRRAFAEMSMEEKNRISHRGKAFRKLRASLKKGTIEKGSR